MPQLSGSNPNLSEAVQTLLSGSGIAFVTSLVGLFCSILFNGYSDIKLSELEYLVNEFNVDLEKSLLFTTEEDLLIQHLKEIAQQGKYLENMDEKIALKIGDIIKDSNQNISETLNKKLSLLQEEISTLINYLQKSQNQNINNINDSIIKIIQNMEDVFKKITENFKKVVSSDLSNSSDEFKKLLETIP